MILSKRFIVEAWVSHPEELELKDSENNSLFFIVGGDTQTPMDMVKKEIDKILIREGISKMLDCYPAEVTVKTHGDKLDTMPRISKFLLMGLGERKG